MNPYQPENLVHTIVALVFYLIMAGFFIYSLLALYGLLKFGRSKILSVTVAIIYLVLAAGLYSTAVINLNNIKY